MKNELLNNKRFDNIDFFKFILSIIIIDAHTHPLENINNRIIEVIHSTIVQCAVPIFFLFSGYLLMNKIITARDNNENTGSETILKNHLFKTIKLYIIWTIIYFPIALYFYITEHNSFLTAAYSFFQGFFFIGSHRNSWILWYLLSSIYALIFVLILNKLKLKTKTTAALGSVLFLIGYVIATIASLPNDQPGFIILLKQIIGYTFYNGRIFSGFLYIPMGMLLREKSLSKPAAASVAVFGFLTSVLCLYKFRAGFDLTLPFFAIGVFSLMLYFNPKPSEKYFYLRKASTVIYFIHLYIYSFFEIFIWYESRLGLVPFLVTTALSLIASFIYVYIKYARVKKDNPA